MIAPSKPIRVLHMEDDMGIARLVERRLRRDGYVVHNASNGEAGLAMHLAQNYDLLITDHRKPLRNGIDVIRHLASRDRLPATIMVTGAGDETIAAEAMRLGADDYIVKDIGDGYLDLLSTVIQRVLQQRRLAREKHEADLALRESEERARQILMSVQVGIVLIDSESHLILEANPTAHRTIGSPDETLVGRPCHEFICKASPDACPFRNTKEVISNLEDEIITKDGHHIPVLRTAVPFMLKGHMHLLESFIDVSRMKDLERQLRQAQKLEAIGQLAAGIAHEINTPAQYVEGNIQFLKGAFDNIVSLATKQQEALDVARGIPDEMMNDLTQLAKDHDVAYLCQEIPQAIADSLDGIERISNIVRAMKEFSHPGTEGKKLTNINQTIQSTITVARNEWKYVADIVTDFEEDLPPVPCLPGDFNQVLLNLIVNAAHAIGKTLVNEDSQKGTITIKTRSNGMMVEVQVSDTGVGIPKDVQSKIFDPFFTTKDVGKGSGQGLAIAHDIIVSKHSGSISVRSDLGRGTTFLIRIPLHPNASKGKEVA